MIAKRCHECGATIFTDAEMEYVASLKAWVVETRRQRADALRKLPAVMKLIQTASKDLGGTNVLQQLDEPFSALDWLIARIERMALPKGA